MAEGSISPKLDESTSLEAFDDCEVALDVSEVADFDFVFFDFVFIADETPTVVVPE